MKLKYWLLTVLAIVLQSCGGSDDPPTPTPITPEVKDPSASTLIFPEDNTECNEGVIDSNNDLKSTVTFEWNISENTDSYEIKVKNLNTSTITTASANTNETSILLDRGVPYEWYVISIATGTSVTATSSTWSFYNQGDGVENYAPFPATAIYPQMGSIIPYSDTITLEWSSSDIDDDIISFEVLFGITSTPETSLGTIDESAFITPITAGTTYYWRVITTDSENNSSNSEIFEFKVE